MFKVGDRVKCINNKGWEDKLKTDTIYTVINVDVTDEIRIRDVDKIHSFWIRGNRFEKVEDNMEKTLLEIIIEGFNNKVYTDKVGNTVYVASNNEVIFNYNKPKNSSAKIDTEILDLNLKFKLERKQYTFTEAFKAYEEGKEIESCVNGYKILQNTFKYPNDISGNWVCLRDSDQIFTIASIRGKWYINN